MKLNRHREMPRLCSIILLNQESQMLGFILLCAGWLYKSDLPSRQCSSSTIWMSSRKRRRKQWQLVSFCFPHDIRRVKTSRNCNEKRKYIKAACLKFPLYVVELFWCLCHSRRGGGQRDNAFWLSKTLLIIIHKRR